MLGNHGLFAKSVMYENSAKIPMVLMPPANRDDLGRNVHDDRLAVQADVFPTLADICGMPIPDTVEGLSLVGDEKREYIFGGHGEEDRPTRMVRDTKHKLVYYPEGNVTQLFDLHDDPRETRDLSGDSEHTDVQARLTDLLIENMYGRGHGMGGRREVEGNAGPEPGIEAPHAKPELRQPARVPLRTGRAGYERAIANVDLNS